MYMAFAFWRVFYNIYLDKIGLNGVEIGTINALFQGTIVVAVTFWGILADKQGIRPTMRYLLIISAIGLFFLGNVHLFWILLFYMPILTFFYHPLGHLTDALAVQYSQSDTNHSYGSLRFWGSLGWAISAIIGGYFFTKIDIKYVFPLSAILLLFVIPFVYTTKKRKTIYRPHFQSMPIKELLKNKPLLIFICILTFYGIACSPVNSYLNLYFKELNASNSTIGMAYAIQAFSELPFFIIGNRLLVKLGAKKVISISIIAMVVRMVLYGFIPNPHVALFVCLIQGISFSFFLVGAVEYLYQLVPPGRHATAQSIIWSTFFGVGQTIGNFIIGFFKDAIGLVHVMQLFSLITLICYILTGIYFIKVKRKLVSDNTVE